MKTIARVKFPEAFINALQGREFPNLRMYCSDWIDQINDDKTMICEIVDNYDFKYNSNKCLDIELALFDYYFNVSCKEEQQERDRFWDLFPDKKLTWTIVKKVTI